MKSKGKTPFFNRELSWLDFNARVLEIALDKATPLFERLRFLAIVSSNLDEFFMVRVGGLQSNLRRGVTATDNAGLSAARQLDDISERVHRMVDAQYACYIGEIQPKLDVEEFRRCHMEELSDQQKAHCESIFTSNLFPVLTPIGIAPELRKTPLVTGRVLHLAVRLAPSGRSKRNRHAIVPLTPPLKRFISVPAENRGNWFILIEDLAGYFINRLFPGERIIECVPFRITRNADMAVQEELAADLMTEMEQIIDERKRSDVVRLEYASGATAAMQSFLKGTFAIINQPVFPVDGPVDLSAFFSMYNNENERLVFPRWTPRQPSWLKGDQSIFDMLTKSDRLLYHPYDSFDPVVRFVEEAADDPDVIAIKQVMYRNSRNSPLIRALVRAAEQGKSVTVLMELKARFDEERNIISARELEDSGVQVIYGVYKLKTHAKICMVVRRDPEGIKRYVHFGTGNYNESTARLYTDTGYLTTDPDLCADASAFFNMLTGYSENIHFRKIEMAPTGLRDRIIEQIRGETIRSKEGQKAFIRAKMNSLVDATIILALYEASQAGVTVELNVRGICCLRPGIRGLSENIRVVSIVDRYLEHSRVFCFCSGGELLTFISSADWMPRNLDRRVELLVPVEDNACRTYLLKHLDLCFRDTVNAWELKSTGSYVRIKDTGRKPFRSQQAAYLMVKEIADSHAAAGKGRLIPRKAAAVRT